MGPVREPQAREARRGLDSRARAELPARDAENASAMTEALVFATTPAAEGGPAALLRVAGTTLLARLLHQFGSLGVPRATVLTRPEWEAAVRTAAAESDLEASVVTARDLSDDLRMAGRTADRAQGSLIVAPAHLLLHREALVGLFADPRPASAILSGPFERSPWSFPFRSVRGRIAAAGSLYHRVGRPTNYSIGVLKVAARDRAELAEAAGKLAALAAEPPHQWEAERERKAADWRLRAAPESVRLDPVDEADLELRARVAASDLTPLLLVGLVRSDVYVFPSSARAYYYASPLSAEGAARAEKELERADEDRARLDAAVKNNDGFFTTFFVSPYSKYLARFAARMGWSPNAITVASFAIGVLAAASFALGSRAGLIVGAILLQVSFTVDCVDGQLARYTRTFSRLGAWLDSVFDRTKEYLVYAGLAVGSIRGFDDDVWILAAATLTLQTVRHLSDFAFMARQLVGMVSAPQAPLEEANEAAWVEPLAALTAPPPDLPFLQRLVLNFVSVLRALRRAGVTRWAGRILAFPIGERFALISLPAALASPRITFIALLAWGGVAATYAFARRVVASYQVSGRIARAVFR
jgi:phosphatidylglycerophosphate synthase